MKDTIFFSWRKKGIFLDYCPQHTAHTIYRLSYRRGKIFFQRCWYDNNCLVNKVYVMNFLYINSNLMYRIDVYHITIHEYIKVWSVDMISRGRKVKFHYDNYDFMSIASMLSKSFWLYAVIILLSYWY